MHLGALLTGLFAAVLLLHWQFTVTLKYRLRWQNSNKKKLYQQNDQIRSFEGPQSTVDPASICNKNKLIWLCCAQYQTTGLSGSTASKYPLPFCRRNLKFFCRVAFQCLAHEVAQYQNNGTLVRESIKHFQLTMIIIYQSIHFFDNNNNNKHIMRGDVSQF